MKSKQKPLAKAGRSTDELIEESRQLRATALALTERMVRLQAEIAENANRLRP
jgi:hypothetical protein